MAAEKRAAGVLAGRWAEHASTPLRCSVDLSLMRFQMIAMMALNSTVNVPFAISFISISCGGCTSLHVHSRTICSISL